MSPGVEVLGTDHPDIKAAVWSRLAVREQRDSRSTFYYHWTPLGRADRYEAEKKRICEIFNESKGRYGYRRVTMQLHNECFTINHKTVERLMREQWLKCLMRNATAHTKVR